MAFYSTTIATGVNLYVNFSNSDYRQSFEKKQKEVVLIYVGSSNCGYARQLEGNELDKAKSWLSEKAKIQDMSFTSTGISVDWSIHDGLKHLLKIGNFDEVITGNNWFNHGILKYIGDLEQETFTPQIFITVREYSSNDLGRRLIKEHPVLILKGRNEIIDWVQEPFIKFK